MRPYRFPLPLLWVVALSVSFPASAKDDYVRRPEIDVLHYRITLTVDPEDSTITGDTEITLAVLKPDIIAVPLDLGDLTVVSVAVDGIPSAFRHADQRLRIDLPRVYDTGTLLRLRIRYHGVPHDGLFIKRNKFGQRTVFADNWPNRARHWFPGIDHPYDKATVEFVVDTPAVYDVIANGRLAETTHRPDGFKRTRWQAEIPIPTYCMVIGVARFSIFHAGAWNGIPVSFYLYPEDRENGLVDFGRSLRMLEFYSELIGPYPYEKLSMVQSSTRFGGMENASAIFYDEKAITGTKRIEGTVAHEIAHQWFGDSVTEADWHHLWLSEGFATYFGALFFERNESRDRFLEMMKRSRDRYLQAYAKTPGPIYNPEITGLFGLLNAYHYNKGAWTLHMLRGLIGDEVFFAGIRDYYRTYRDRTVLTEDFQRVMEFHAKRPLGWFFQQWIYESGHPVFEVSWRWDTKKKEAEVVIRQTQPGFVYRLSVDVVVVAQHATEKKNVEVSEREHRMTFVLPVRPEKVMLDPDEWVLKEVVVR